MAVTGAVRQAEYECRKRKKLADALAEVERLQERVAVLERERDRLDGLLGFALKQEEWAAAERLRAGEAEREFEADEAMTRVASWTIGTAQAVTTAALCPASPP